MGHGFGDAAFGKDQVDGIKSTRLHREVGEPWTTLPLFALNSEETTAMRLVLPLGDIPTKVLPDRRPLYDQATHLHLLA